MRNLYRKLGRVLYWLAWPVSWPYLRWSRRTRLLLVCGDEIMLVNNWLGTGKLNLPGGGLHKGEDPELGLLREAFEETGVRLRPDLVRPLASEMYRIHGFQYMTHYFIAVVDTKPATVAQRFEILDIKWTPRSEVSGETCGPDVLRALELAKPVKPV